MVRLGDLSLLDTLKKAKLTDTVTGTEIIGWLIPDPLWRGKMAFKAEDNDDVISIFDTDEIELL